MEETTEEQHEQEKVGDMHMTYNGRSRNGIYNDEVYKQWHKLLLEVRDFMPDHAVSGGLKGTCAMMRAKAKSIELQARSLYEITKAVLPDRK